MRTGRYHAQRNKQTLHEVALLVYYTTILLSVLLPFYGHYIAQPELAGTQQLRTGRFRWCKVLLTRAIADGN